jgi:peptide/nickel transport system substrate-binding protein
MKNIKLLTMIATCLLLLSIFTVIPAFSVQPPIDTSTYYLGTIGQPARLDPGRAYDTASGDIIEMVYEPLIWFGDQHVLTLTSGADYNLTAADHSDLSVFVPIIATALPTITPSGIGTGQLWTFTLNTNAMFQTWIGPDGSVQPKRAVTVDDVIYSFQIQMVMDSPYAPVWMLETPAFNIMTFDQIFTSGGTTGLQGFNAADEAAVAKMIQQWCYAGPGPNQVTFNFTYPLPQAAMDQIFAQTWGSIVNKDFFIAHGNWNYSWYPGWSADYRRMPDGAGNRTPIDRYYAAKSQYKGTTPVVGTDCPDMCGTGPYHYTFGAWNQVTKTWRLDYDPTYWRGFANAGDGKGNFLHTIIEEGIDTWPTRKMLFLDGEFDTAVVPRANMFDLLVGGDKYKPLAGLTLVTNITQLVDEMVFFCFNVSGESAYQSYVGYPTHATGVEPNFFNDIHIRTAFAYALNYTAVIQQAWFGEAVQQASWWVDGLVPAEAKNTAITMRNVDLNLMKSELAQAALIEGHNVSSEGFETTMVYNTGNDQRMIELQSMAAAFASLGTKYKCNVVGLDWPVFLDNMNGMDMPIFCLGWLADYADPSDWAAPYQQSSGSFLYTQGPPFPADQAAVDAEIVAAATEPDMAKRNAAYQHLQLEFWTDIPSIPVVQPVGRRFAHDWVQGWYYNDLLPGLPYFSLYKAAPTSYQPVDLDATGTITGVTTYPKVYVSMGQMKVLYGGGVTASMTFTVHVKRDDSNTNVALLAAAVALERFNLTDLATPAPTYPGFVGPAWAGVGGPTWFVQYYGTARKNVFVPCQAPAFPTTLLVLLGPGADTTVTLTWYEDGVSIGLPANATWSIGTLVGIAQTGAASDSNLANNGASIDPNTYNATALTNTVEIPHGTSTYDKYILITGDINGDAVVNILDAIQLANSFGKNFGQTGYNSAADLNSDGTVNILDAILLANHFNQKAL